MQLDSEYRGKKAAPPPPESSSPSSLYRQPLSSGFKSLEKHEVKRVENFVMCFILIRVLI